MKINTKIFVFFIFIHVNTLFSQTQIGEIIYGANEGDNTGASVAVSPDGSVIAFGSVGANSGEGSVSVFEWVNDEWTQKGGDIVTTGPDVGRYVALSEDANIIAVSSRGYQDFTGKVSVFEYINNTWTQLGADIVGEDTYNSFGKVDISGDGSKIIVGAYQNSSNGTTSGNAKAYEYAGGSWTQLGQELVGGDDFENFGYSVAMSLDGDKIIIGAIDYQGPGSNKGYAKAYELIGSTWTQLGSTIFGVNSGDWAGYDVDMTGSGDRIVIGAIRNDGGVSNGGQARVFDYINSDWVQVGSDIYGTTPGERLGWKVSISHEGDSLAVGSKNSAVGNSSGRAQHFRFEDGDWTQTGNEITGVVDDWQTEMEMSGNGKVVIIGALLNDTYATNAGKVFVNDFESIVCDSISLNHDLTGSTLRNIIECSENGDTIYFSSILAGDTIILDDGLGPIIIEDSITIVNDFATIWIDAQELVRFCDISPGGLLKINNIHVLGGANNPYCIDNEGTLDIDNVKCYKGYQSGNMDQCILNNGTMIVRGDSEVR